MKAVVLRANGDPSVLKLEEWPDVAYCVGVFRLEGRGVQLFQWIEGDHFTILGMPLIALLGALRERELIAS